MATHFRQHSITDQDDHSVTGLTATEIIKVNVAGTALEDSGWRVLGNDIYPVVSGSNIGLNGSPEYRIGTIYLASNLDYVSELLFNENGIERARFQNGNFGIGVSNPSANFHVNGTFKYTDGNEALGKVLTSDANGNISWETPSGGLSGLTTGELVFATGSSTVDTDGNLLWNDSTKVMQIGSGTPVFTSTQRLNLVTTGLNGLSLVNSNTTTTSIHGFGFYEDSASGLFNTIVRHNSAVAGNYQATTVARANTFRFTAGNQTTTTLPIVLQGNPVYAFGGSTGTNKGFRQDEIGLRIDDMANLHTTNTHTLHVAGTLKYVDGNQSSGYVLTSDANGVATWQVATGSNFATADLTLTGNRSHDLGGFNFSLGGIGAITIGDFTTNGLISIGYGMTAGGISIGGNVSGSSVEIGNGAENLVIGGGPQTTFSIGNTTSCVINIGQDATADVNIGDLMSANLVLSPQLSKSAFTVLGDYTNLDFTDDTQASANGVPLGGIYHTSGVLKIRTV